MISCKEFELDDLLAITAVPVVDFSLGTSAWQLKPTIANGLLGIEAAFSESTIVVGLVKATRVVSGVTQTVGKLVPIRRMTGKAKDSESDSVAGRLHTVTVNCEVDDRDLSADGDGLTVLDYLLALERTPCHLLLTFRGGQRAFVAATNDTYMCETTRESAKTSLSFKIQNLMGIQLIIV